jgi:3'-5' exoribonuclease
MKSPTVAELRAGKANGSLFSGLFLVQSKDVREGKTGRKYMSLTLMDRTGEIDARMWDNVETATLTFERDDFVRVEGETQEYQGKRQLIVHKLRKASDGEVDPRDYLPASRRDTAEMYAELKAIIASFRNPHLKTLLDAVFANESIARDYRTAPAAKSIHHAWLGGLLEHNLSLCALARQIGAHYVARGYPVDLELLLAGVILHDIGKVEELRFDRSFSYSTAGQLLGHIVIGVQMVEEKLRGLTDFPPKLRLLLEHMILSHHGQMEFGSPKVPLFLEAMLLNQIDTLDARMATMLASVEKDRDGETEWTGYNPALERQVLDKEFYLQERPANEAGNAMESKAAPGPAGRPKLATALGSALQAAFTDQPPGGR